MFENVCVALAQFLENLQKVVRNLWKIVKNIVVSTWLLVYMEYLFSYLTYSCNISLISCAHSWDIKLKALIDIPYVLSSIYYSQNEINGS